MDDMPPESTHIETLMYALPTGDRYEDRSSEAPRVWDTGKLLAKAVEWELLEKAQKKEKDGDRKVRDAEPHRRRDRNRSGRREACGSKRAASDHPSDEGHRPSEGKSNCRRSGGGDKVRRAGPRHRRQTRINLP